MLSEFIEQKLKTAKYKMLKNGSFFGEIPEARGVWANADNLEECRNELREVLEDWALLKIREQEAVAGLRVGTMYHGR